MTAVRTAYLKALCDAGFDTMTARGEAPACRVRKQRFQVVNSYVDLDSTTVPCKMRHGRGLDIAAHVYHFHDHRLWKRFLKIAVTVYRPMAFSPQLQASAGLRQSLRYYASRRRLSTSPPTKSSASSQHAIPVQSASTTIRKHAACGSGSRWTLSCRKGVAVGTIITDRPPHGSVLALLTHTVLTLGVATKVRVV